MTDPPVVLTVRVASEASRRLRFAAATDVVVGRGDDCDLRLVDPRRRVSRHHCRFEVRPPRARVHDLGSRNGTLVNGRRVTVCALHDGDEVRVGPARVTVAGPTAMSRCPGYTLVEELGRGAQGVVHLAREDATGDHAAVKVLATEGAPSAAARAAFVREMESTRALRHGNVVGFRGAGVTATGAPFFAADLCAGGTVAALVDRHGRLEPALAVRLAQQVLAGLDHAHTADLPEVRTTGGVRRGRGLVHRDLHPGNLLLADADADADRPVVRIADLGLAKAYETAGWSGMTATGALGGSPAFMPRRQVVDFRGARPDVDVWAAAAVLYWMLTGTTPRDFPELADPVAVVLREPVVPLRDRDVRVPSRLAEVVDAVLADDGPDRPDRPVVTARTLSSWLDATLSDKTGR